MFRTPEGQSFLRQNAEAAEQNYVLRVNDVFTMKVFTQDGERIIDPDFALTKDIPATANNLRPEVEFLINADGEAKLPKLDTLRIAGLTIREAERLLQNRYAEFYNDVYVVINCLSRRVVVLGAPGGQVIPLTNENMRLPEVIALAGGISNDAHANNIRVLRGDTVWVADFTTIEGYRTSNMVMQPGDIIYIEPIRRPVSEGFRDYAPVISVITSLTTLIVVVLGL